tara:strand:+ start:157 stop:363 length:207 start_codon:yes stop_codon:yes gene_type:complete
VRSAIRGGKTTPEVSSQLIVYAVAQAFKISPMEVYRMPARLVKDMLMIHQEAKILEAEEYEKAQKKIK